MNSVRARVAVSLLLLLASTVAGCAGAGPAGSRGAASHTRCGSGPADQQRPLFFLFCVESP